MIERFARGRRENYEMKRRIVKSLLVSFADEAAIFGDSEKIMKKIIALLLLITISTACGARSDATTPEMAQRLLKLRGFDYSEEEFFKAVKGKDAPSIELFFQAGIDPNAKNKAGETALTHAAANSDADTVEQLLKRADPNLRDNQGNTPLFVALKKKNFNIFDLLLKSGADPNSTGVEGNTQNQSVLYVAVLINRPDIVRQLLDKGADPQLADSGGAMPVSEQIIYSSPDLDTVDLLLSKMTNVNQPEKDGSTLLIFAAKNTKMSAAKRQQIIEKLLAKGADKSLKDKNGKTALDYAKENKQKEAIALLQ